MARSLALLTVCGALLLGTSAPGQSRGSSSRSAGAGNAASFSAPSIAYPASLPMSLPTPSPTSSVAVRPASGAQCCQDIRGVTPSPRHGREDFHNFGDSNHFGDSRFKGSERFEDSDDDDLVFVPVYYPIYSPYYSYPQPQAPAVQERVKEPAMHAPDPAWKFGEAYLRKDIEEREGRPVPPRAQEIDLQSKSLPGTESKVHAPEDSTTVLVFRDKRRMWIHNYAIVGATLIDLTPGHARKIALAELDLPATIRLNQQEGLEFRLPLAYKPEITTANKRR